MSFFDNMAVLDGGGGDAPGVTGDGFLADMTAPVNQPAPGEIASNDPINRAAAGTYSPYEQSVFNLFVTDIGRAPTQKEFAAWAGDATRQAAWNANPSASSIGAPTVLSVPILPAPGSTPSIQPAGNGTPAPGGGATFLLIAAGLAAALLL